MENALCLSPAPHGGVEALRSDFAELFESAYTGRKTAGNAISKQTALIHQITHHLEVSKGAGVWAAPSIPGARWWLKVPGTAHLPGDQKEVMGLTSTMEQVLGWGCWLWRSSGCSKESLGDCKWSGLCSEEQAGGSPRL